jgi:peptide/nickel transport system permease protein
MKLLMYLIRRLLYLVPVLLGVVMLVFFIGRILPGDPVYLFLGQEVDQATIDQITKELGLDQPIWVQFKLYIQGLLRGDLGMAWHTRNPVVVDIKQRFPATLELTTISLLLCVFIAIPLGVIAAVKRDGLLDHVCRVLSLVGVAMPSFWLGLLAIYFGFYKLGFFPPPLGRAGIGFRPPGITGLFTVDTLLVGDITGFWMAVRFLALPVISLALINMAPLTRLTRSSMIEVLQSDYIKAAQAAGLRERVVQYRFALKNAIIAPITMLGMMYGRLLGGAVIVETLFAWPGIGMWAVNAAKASDYAPVQAVALLAATIKVIVFLVLDLVYFALDPRIRVG